MPRTHLDRIKAQVGSHPVHDVLSKHHALGTTETPEGSVGGQVGLTCIAGHSHVLAPVANTHSISLIIKPVFSIQCSTT